MTWKKTPADRRRDSQVYGAEWRKARDAALRRTGRRCEKCRSGMEITVDHIIPVSQGGTHAAGNLQVLCGPCHRHKTATERGGSRSSGRRKAGDPEPSSRIIWADPKPRPPTRW